ncbi:MAG: acetoacetate decarboxylase [Phycisphaerales bacterium]|nr:acetoacetate decarboxylase [Phycisphaerales bacterium]
MSSYFNMPYDRFNKSYPNGPFRFINREYFNIFYKTDKEKLTEILPHPLKPIGDEIIFEFIKMPDSIGLGSYTEAGQVIPVSYNGVEGNFVTTMFLDAFSSIAAGREIWGFPKKYAKPTLEVDVDTLLGTLHYGKVQVATATMGYKYQEIEHKKARTALQKPNFLLKVLPGVDGKAEICQLVALQLEQIEILGAWAGPATIELHHHIHAPVAHFDVKKVIGATHLIANLTLPYGKVVENYLKK